jgi:hypothetical protein
LFFWQDVVGDVKTLYQQDLVLTVPSSTMRQGLTMGMGRTLTPTTDSLICFRHAGTEAEGIVTEGTGKERTGTKTTRIEGTRTGGIVTGGIVTEGTGK